MLGERATTLRYTYLAYDFTASRRDISKLQFCMHMCLQNFVATHFISTKISFGTFIQQEMP